MNKRVDKKKMGKRKINKEAPTFTSDLDDVKDSDSDFQLLEVGR